MRTCYFLLPAEPFYTEFQETIRQLARELNAPVFEPHVTVFVAHESPEDNASAILHRVTAHLCPLLLTAAEYAWTPMYTKSLFLEFDADASLTQLHATLRKLSAMPTNYELRPHLSMAYKQMTPDLQENIARELAVPRSLIRFDRMKAVRVPDQIESPGEVESWVTLAECALACEPVA